MPHADAAFTIGKTHTVCQDYALAQNASGNSPLCAAWLSDGCSSSPHTDIGARLLVHATQTQASQIAANSTRKIEAQAQIQTALNGAVCRSVQQGKQIAAQMGVSDSALDATLLGLMETGASGGETRTLHAVMVGDGALVLGKTDGTRIVYRAHFAAGYPFYPPYLEDTDRLAQWRGVKSNTHTVTKTVLRPDGRVQSERTVTLPLNRPRFVFRFPVAELRFAAVLSDGVESFQRRVNGDAAPQSVPYLDAVRELTDFKQFAGQFAQRRLQAFEKACATRLNWQHSDDVSLAALFFG